MVKGGHLTASKEEEADAADIASVRVRVWIGAAVLTILGMIVWCAGALAKAFKYDDTSHPQKERGTSMVVWCAGAIIEVPLQAPFREHFGCPPCIKNEGHRQTHGACLGHSMRHPLFACASVHARMTRTSSAL